VVLDHYHQRGIPLLDLAAEVSGVEVEVTAQDSADQEPVEVTLDDLWEEFEVVADRQAVPLEEVESSADVASEPVLVEAGQLAIEAEPEEPEEDLEAVARLLEEVESDIEAEEVVTGDEMEGESAVEPEDEADPVEEDATAEEDGEVPEEEDGEALEEEGEEAPGKQALDLAGVLPEAPGEAASLEFLPDQMVEYEEDSSSSLQQIRELWLFLLMAVLGSLIGLVVYLGYRDGFQWPWSSESDLGEPASTELLAAFAEEEAEKREIITKYDFEDPAQIGDKFRGPAGGETPAGTATPPEVNRSDPEPETRPAQASTRERPPPRPTADEVLTGVDRITWQESQDQTVLTLWGDGPFDTDQLVVYRLDTGTPRQVVRILGVSRPFSQRNLAVGTSHVSAIRTGLHTSDVGQELHVVADLEDPTVRMRRVEPEGSQLHVYFSKL